MSDTFNVLTLDGGGSKGIFSIGVLKEVEAMVRRPLWEFFDLVYGSSTGAIIASALAVGLSTKDIDGLYMNLIPKIMKRWTRWGRSRALRAALRDAFGTRTFDDCKCMLGVVATDFADRKPVIFKSAPKQARGLADTFVPGFGCTIADAVEASCSAYPLFKRRRVATANQGRPLLADGGFSANNPTLLAMVDANQVGRGKMIRVLSVGVGQYPEKKPWRAFFSAFHHLPSARLIELQFAASATCLARVSEFSALDAGMAFVRVDDTFAEPSLAASLLEYNIEKLDRIRTKGREAFGKRESAIREMLVASG